MFIISPRLSLPDHEIEIDAVRAQGAGGQNVNKVASAVHLRFDIGASSLPEALKAQLLAQHDRRITREGVVVIKAQRHRTQERNLDDALERLRELILAAAHVPKARKATRPTRGSQQRRLAEKTRRGEIKVLRTRPGED